MFYRVQEDTVTVSGIKMDHIAFGTSTRPLIMIQGLNTRGIRGAGFSLAYMYRIFAKEYRVHLFDRREPVSDGITVRELAADTAAAMDALGITDADVLGVSQGGMIAQYLAIDRPELVRRLALAMTLSRNNPTVEDVLDNWIALTDRGEMRVLVTDMAEKMYSPAYLKKYRPFLPLLTVLQKPKDTARFITLAKACLTCNTYDILDKIHCPVFVIGGKRDAVIGPTACAEIAERLACPLHLYEDLGHASYEEAAADFNRRTMAFFCE